MLGHVGSLGERVDLLRRGDRGVLKVAAPPHTIESVLSTFLPRYAERFPNVHVKLTEALGRDTSAMLERGEVHVGIRHDQDVDRHFASRALPPDEILAACDPSLAAWPCRHYRYRPPCRLSVALAGIGLLTSAGCSTRLAVSHASSPTFCSRAARRTPCLRWPRPGRGSRSFPHLLRTDRYALRIVRVTHLRKPLREPLAIHWDKRRPLPPYAESFCEALAEYMREVLPITQPSESKLAAARKQPAVRKSRRR